MGQSGFRTGVKSGVGGFREVAAYILDHDNFASVPPTFMASSMHNSYEYGLEKE